jgi:hypothetical protein
MKGFVGDQESNELAMFRLAIETIGLGFIVPCRYSMIDAAS